MSNPTEIIRTLSEVIELLSHPLKATDVAVGWTEDNRQNWYRGLKSLKDELVRKPQGDYARINTARALGMEGIDRGVLAERIAHVGSLLMNLNH